MPRRNKIQREKDLAKIAHMYLNEHKPQVLIAYEIGVHQTVISDDLKELVKRWRNLAFQDMDAAKAAELERINQLEIEYWDAWRKSSEMAMKAISSKEVGKQVVRVSVKEENRFGNPAFLAGVQWCIDKRCQLLGLNAPVKHRLGTDDGDPIRIRYDLSGLPIEVLRVLAGYGCNGEDKKNG